ncbi:MAG: hypothetical protein KAT58_11480 [candidate division Zixibacteria bacterium]|nr:hypothetical protein [candidate division Zixibacteria bacterium]
MKNIIIVMMVTLIAITFMVGCANDSPSEPEAQYHEFTVVNSTAQYPKQLTRLEVTPVGGGTTLVNDFVCNPTEQKNVNIPIPSMGAYQVTIYSADGQSMWWNSVSLGLPGNSRIVVCSPDMSGLFHGECAGLPNSGVNMTP